MSAVLPWAVRVGLVLPWVLYFSFGPSPAVLQSLVCAATLGAWGFFGTRKCPEHGPAGSPTLWVVWCWLLAATLSCHMALLQYFDLAEGLQPWVSASKGEAFANLRQRNQFAVLCLIGLASWRWLIGNATVEKTWRPALIACWALLILGNAASQSRTGLIGLILLVVLPSVWKPNGSALQRRLTWGALPAYALASVLLPILAGRSGQAWGALSRLSEADAQCQSRLTLWSNVLHLIQQKPWFGWGWGELDYAHYAKLYPGERFCAILDNAHNLPLHLAVELGVPVALLFCIGVIYLIWRQRPWAETDATRQMAWMILAVIGLHSLLEYPLWYGPFQMTVLLCIYLLWRPFNSTGAVRVGAGKQAAGTYYEKNRPFRQYSVRLFALIFGAFLLYVGWDYHRISQIYLAPQDRSTAYAENTLAKIQGSWLFQTQVQFAEIAITPLTQANAEHQLKLALDLLHFSPEPRVIERVLDAALVLHRDDVLAFHMLRYQAAFPDAYVAWQQKAMPPQSSQTSPRASQAASRP